MNSIGYSPGKCNDRTFPTVLFRAKISHEIVMPEGGTASLSLPAAVKESSIFGRRVQQMMRVEETPLTKNQFDTIILTLPEGGAQSC